MDISPSYLHCTDFTPSTHMNTIKLPIPYHDTTAACAVHPRLPATPASEQMVKKPATFPIEATQANIMMRAHAPGTRSAARCQLVRPAQAAGGARRLLPMRALLR